MLPHDQPESSFRRLRLTDPQLHALEYLLNDLSRHGLQVQPAACGQWHWEWEGQSGLAPGLGTAVLDALA